MENVKIISDNGTEINVFGLFYVFNLKYYFIYTTGEIVENDYVKLYVVQVCKEIKNTPNGPLDTGYMLGMEISNTEEWAKVQDSITKIVEDKKNGTQNPEIQYLPMTMLNNLKIVSNNKFKLMRNIVENNFKVELIPNTQEIVQNEVNVDITNNTFNNSVPLNQLIETPTQIVEPIPTTAPINPNNNESVGEVIIDYRARFFEEQDKNQELQEQIKMLNEKLENIKNIVG